MIHTGEFLDGVEKHLQEAVERGDNGASEALSLGRDQGSQTSRQHFPRISVFR